SYPHDVRSREGLTSIYNEPVVKATEYERPLNGWKRKYGPLKHSGVVVQTKDGKTHLVHKGNDYGRSSNTVVVDTKHMSSKWERTGKRRPGETVGDFVKRGGKDYNAMNDNCHDATKNNMDPKGKTP
ncbi:predicted protein, partial [Nematostella vectensis]